AAPLPWQARTTRWHSGPLRPNSYRLRYWPRKRLSSRTGAFFQQPRPLSREILGLALPRQQVEPLLDGPLEARAGCNIEGEGVQPEKGHFCRRIGLCRALSADVSQRRLDACGKLEGRDGDEESRAGQHHETPPAVGPPAR